jgi:hypothetical protein
VDADALAAIDDLYADAGAAFPGSALLSLFTAQYHGSIQGNRHLERIHLRACRAKAGGSAIDVLCMAAGQAWARDSGDASNHTAARMTVERRMRYEQLLAQSRAEVTACREAQLSFWSGGRLHPVAAGGHGLHLWRAGGPGAAVRVGAAWFRRLPAGAKE